MKYPLKRSEKTLMAIGVGVCLGWVWLCCFGIPFHRKDVAAPRPEWDGKCYGRPGDAGRVVYWRGPPYLPGDGGHYGTRYVCVDHDERGWWFEARPRDWFTQ